jgi:uncharacterized membrane protein (GlpM family)
VHDVAIIALKGLAGGLLVVVFALLSESLEPKRFAGLFSAAPSVAIAGLVITLLDKGSGEAQKSTYGMIAGAVAMMAFGLMVLPLLRRQRPGRASIIALIGWIGVAACVATPLLLLA